MIPTASIASRHELDVAAPPERAFEVFTAGIGDWWAFEGHHVGAEPAVDAVIEPRPGGFFGEVDANGVRSPWGSVLEWEPPARVLLAWNLDADFRHDPAVQTEVEVTFAPDGAGGTRVVLEHRLDGFGERAAAMREVFDAPNAWRELLGAYARTAAV